MYAIGTGLGRDCHADSLGLGNCGGFALNRVPIPECNLLGDIQSGSQPDKRGKNIEQEGISRCARRRRDVESADNPQAD